MNIYEHFAILPAMKPNIYAYNIFNFKKSYRRLEPSTHKSDIMDV